MTTLSDLINNTAPAEPVKIELVDLAVPLMDFQRETVETILRGEPHTLAALQMGTGKTPTAIAAILSANVAGIKKALVVCPATLVFNWQREFAKFAPSLTVAPLSGKTPYPIPNVDVCVISEAVLSSWHDSLIDKFGVLVVDESHMFKSRKAQRTKALKSVASTVPHLRILLTGTPNPNGSTEEFAAQFDILGDEAWRDIKGKGNFYSRFCPKVDSWGRRGTANLEEFNQLLKSTFMVRLLRSDVLPGFKSGEGETPITKGRSGILLHCDNSFSKKYKAAANDLREYLRGEGIDTRGYDRAEALVRMNYLRQLAGMSKIQPVIDHVKGILEEQDGGVFVVAEHAEVIERLSVALFPKYNAVTISGKTSQGKRAEAVDAFNSGNARVLVGQIKAAGVGLTLHGDGRNSRVVVTQLPWTPADLLQAEDRLFRMGQTKDVDIDVCLAAIDGEWTIDERLWGRLESKNFATDQILDGEGQYLLYDASDEILNSFKEEA